MRADGGVGEDGDLLRLDFQRAATDEDRLLALAVLTRTSPALISDSSGAWRGVMPSSPSFAGTNTISASPAKISPSALTMSTWMVLAMCVASWTCS